MRDRAKSTTSHIGSPLRRAGQELEEHFAGRLMDRAVLYMLVIVVPAGLALLEWLHASLKLKPAPFPATVIAVIGIVIGMTGLIRTLGAAHIVNLGIRGERVVADALERLRSAGYEVFHDVQGEGFNVDHVLVGPGGVFVVETKARSKRRGAVVTYQRDKVLVDGFAPDRDPIEQVRDASVWVGKLIRSECDLDPPIRPVVVFPGWYIEGSSSGRHVWVLSEKGLRGFVANEPPCLGPDDAARIARMLSARNRQHNGTDS
jgi:hypothetical protein